MGKSKRLNLIGDIDEEAFGNFAEAFQEADRTPGPIALLVSSDGGSVDVGTAMYELIRTSQNQVVTIGVGCVASMAVLVLLAGDHRVLTEGSSLLLHDGTIRMNASLVKARDVMAENLRQHDWYIQQVALRTKQDPKFWTRICSKESFFTAEEALKLNLVDEIKRYRPLKKIKLTRK